MSQRELDALSPPAPQFRRQPSQFRRRPSLLHRYGLDAATLAVVAAISAIVYRPLLEEWGFIDVLNAGGAWSYWNRVPNFLLRPFQGIPTVAQWLIDGGHAPGFAIGGFLMLVVRYVAARWAVTPLANGVRRWGLATLAMLLPPWTAEWYLRYSAAQLSAVFFFIALGAAVRCSQRLTRTRVAVGAIAAALMLASYEALTVCLLALPFVAMLATPEGWLLRTRRAWQRAIRAAVPVAAGLIIWGAYAVVATHLGSLGAGYEADTVQHGHINSVPAVLRSIRGIYHTAFARPPWALWALGAVLLVLAVLALGFKAGPGKAAWACCGVAAVTAALPLAAAPYIVNQAFITDPDRVTFPVAVAFACAAIVLTARTTSRRAGPAIIGALTILAIVSTSLASVTAYRYDKIQRDVIGGVITQAREHHATSVLVEDETGELGGYYTLYPPVLEEAMIAERTGVKSAVLCTPAGVVGGPLSASPTCTSSMAKPGTLVLKVVKVGNGNLAVVAS